MNKIKDILIGTNNSGKLREIRDLLPNKVKIYSPKEFKLKRDINSRSWPKWLSEI